MNLDSFTVIIIIFIILICYRLYIQSDFFQLKCVISTVDGNKYCVRERNKLKQAADLLALVNQNLKSVVEYCKEYHIDKDVTRHLIKNFNADNIVEILPTSEYTAYSENKGQKLAFCVNKNNKKEENGKLIDINTLTYVALHELAHIGSKSIGHTPEFWSNFKFLLIQAEKIKVYKPIDYSKNNEMYCGMEITDNPYFNEN